MKVTVLRPVQFGDLLFEPGIHEVCAADAESLMIRGCVRPATAAEIATIEHESAAPVEMAIASPARETATAKPSRRTR